MTVTEHPSDTPSKDPVIGEEGKKKEQDLSLGNLIGTGKTAGQKPLGTTGEKTPELSLGEKASDEKTSEVSLGGQAPGSPGIDVLEKEAPELSSDKKEPEAGSSGSEIQDKQDGDSGEKPSESSGEKSSEDKSSEEKTEDKSSEEKPSESSGDHGTEGPEAGSDEATSDGTSQEEQTGNKPTPADFSPVIGADGRVKAGFRYLEGKEVQYLRPDDKGRAMVFCDINGKWMSAEDLNRKAWAKGGKYAAYMRSRGLGSGYGNTPEEEAMFKYRDPEAPDREVGMRIDGMLSFLQGMPKAVDRASSGLFALGRAAIAGHGLSAASGAVAAGMAAVRPVGATVDELAGRFNVKDPQDPRLKDTLYGRMRQSEIDGFGAAMADLSEGLEGAADPTHLGDGDLGPLIDGLRARIGEVSARGLESTTLADRARAQAEVSNLNAMLKGMEKELGARRGAGTERDRRAAEDALRSFDALPEAAAALRREFPEGPNAGRRWRDAERFTLSDGRTIMIPTSPKDLSKFTDTLQAVPDRSPETEKVLAYAKERATEDTRNRADLRAEIRGAIAAGQGLAERIMGKGKGMGSTDTTHLKSKGINIANRIAYLEGRIDSGELSDEQVEEHRAEIDNLKTALQAVTLTRTKSLLRGTGNAKGLAEAVGDLCGDERFLDNLSALADDEEVREICDSIGSTDGDRRSEGLNALADILSRVEIGEDAWTGASEDGRTYGRRGQGLTDGQKAAVAVADAVTDAVRSRRMDADARRTAGTDANGIKGDRSGSGSDEGLHIEFEDGYRLTLSNDPRDAFRQSEAYIRAATGTTNKEEGMELAHMADLYYKAGKLIEYGHHNGEGFDLGSIDAYDRCIESFSDAFKVAYVSALGKDGLSDMERRRVKNRMYRRIWNDKALFGKVIALARDPDNTTTGGRVTIIRPGVERLVYELLSQEKQVKKGKMSEVEELMAEIAGRRRELVAAERKKKRAEDAAVKEMVDADVRETTGEIAAEENLKDWNSKGRFNSAYASLGHYLRGMNDGELRKVYDRFLDPVDGKKDLRDLVSMLAMPQGTFRRTGDLNADLERFRERYPQGMSGAGKDRDSAIYQIRRTMEVGRKEAAERIKRAELKNKITGLIKDHPDAEKALGLDTSNLDGYTTEELSKAIGSYEDGLSAEHIAGSRFRQALGDIGSELLGDLIDPVIKDYVRPTNGKTGNKAGGVKSSVSGVRSRGRVKIPSVPTSEQTDGDKKREQERIWKLAMDVANRVGAGGKGFVPLSWDNEDDRNFVGGKLMPSMDNKWFPLTRDFIGYAKNNPNATPDDVLKDDTLFERDDFEKALGFRHKAAQDKAKRAERAKQATEVKVNPSAQIKVDQTAGANSTAGSKEAPTQTNNASAQANGTPNGNGSGHGSGGTDWVLDPDL